MCHVKKACPSHVSQNDIAVGTKLQTAEVRIIDPWSKDQADLVS